MSLLYFVETPALFADQSYIQLVVPERESIDGVFGAPADASTSASTGSSRPAPQLYNQLVVPVRESAGLGLGGLRWTMGGLRCLSILAGGGSIIPVGRCGGMGCGPKRAAPPPYRPASGGVM